MSELRKQVNFKLDPTVVRGLHVEHELSGLDRTEIVERALLAYGVKRIDISDYDRAIADAKILRGKDLLRGKANNED